MSATPITSEQDQSDILHCKRCQMVLPHNATFCGKCGERVEQLADSTRAKGKNDIAEHYRITSLVRRRPYTQILRAIDTQQHRSVVINDIDISGLDDNARSQALTDLQREYDLLRSQHPTDVMPLIDLRSTPEHLYLIAGWPLTANESGQSSSQRVYTLQEILQSGIGLPNEQTALAWINRLSKALESLHKNRLVLEDLDPETIFVNQSNYEGQPSLLVCWLPSRLRDLPQQALNNIDAAAYSAPDARTGQPDPRSDIYSLGAILYLLLTGVSPGDPATRARQPLRTTREFNTRINSDIDAVVMRALALDPAIRFQSADEFSQALHRLYSESGVVYPAQGNGGRPIKAAGKAKNNKEVIHFSSKSGDNKTSDSKTDGDKTDDSNQRQTDAEPDDATISIVPLQAQMARRYLSRIKTGKLGTPDELPEGIFGQEGATRNQPTGEAFVEEAITKNKATGEAFVEEGVMKKHKTGKGSGNGPTRKSRPELVKQPEVVKPVAAEPVEVAKVKPVATDETIRLVKPVEVDKTIRLVKPVEVDKTIRLVKPVKADETIKSVDAEPVQVVPVTRTAELIDIEDVPTQAISLNKELPVKAEETPADTAEEESEQEIYEQGTIPIPTDKVEEASVGAASQSQEQHLEEIPEEQEPVVANRNGNHEAAVSQSEERKDSTLGRFRDLITGSLPAIPRVLQPKNGTTAEVPLVPDEKEKSFLKRMQRFILGEQQHNTTAAALIETPMRIQPNQGYSVRINLMGRKEAKGVKPESGLKCMVEGDIVHIEVRSALYQNYAYIVQQADVKIPAEGYVAEVTMPMQPLSSGPSGRRERLHIFFMNGAHSPLYEKPFVIELFISHLVQSGREGHSVLSIPL